MRQSELCTKTRKTVPKDEVALNAKLLIRAGFINKEMAGVYSYFPLGLRVLKKIENIVREEMNSIGGQEVFLTTLQNPDLWKKTGRWSDKAVDTWFKTKDSKFGFSWTHEEAIASMMRHHINSYKDLPRYIYQFQTKLRNEPRAKSGLLRGKEFIMKDLYSLDKDEDGLENSYGRCKDAYKKIFSRVGIGDRTYITFASGEPFSKFSHEFQTLSSAGEDTIYLHKKKRIAINKEVYTESVIKDLGLNKKDLTEEKAIEVGNIFKLGTKYSSALNLKYIDENGKERPVVMGSYGIGLGRLMATVVEVLSDQKGIVWPESIAPFRAHLIEIGDGLGKKLYEKLQKKDIDVLYDDRIATAGEKFNDADLIGIPWRLVVSERTKDKAEIKERTSSESKLINYEGVIQKLL
jgi:prolyl-tRNA synthetase